MSSEGERSKGIMKQPWKEWYADLKLANVQTFQDGAPVLQYGPDGTGGGPQPVPAPNGHHGTTSLQKKQVDLNAFKEKPALKVRTLFSSHHSHTRVYGAIDRIVNWDQMITESSNRTKWQLDRVRRQSEATE